jgi:beta-fructofuranosidase
MNGSSPDVGCLYVGTLSPEQTAAYDWCADAANRAERLSFAQIRRDDVHLDAYDVLWWHTAEAPDDGVVTESADAVRSFLADGGGLFLSQRALSAVTTLGIDDVPPDATGREELTRVDGFLWAARHADHPAVEDGELRIPTLPDGLTHSYARYEEVLPARGELLSSMTRGPDDSPKEMSTFAWRHGAGTVIGAGCGLVFDDADRFAAERAQVAGGVLSSLADDRWTVTGRPKSGGTLASMRSDLDAADPHRPRYHLSPPANWLNDPNGIIQYDGRYHVFYQYNPAGPFHHTIHWGHAVSDDLVHWEDEPVALTPSPDGPDRDGCWSGCAVLDDDGTPTVLYTGGRDEWQLPCLATADGPDLRTWTKHPDNPVIEDPPSDPEILSTEHWAAEFRDHCVWREDGTWYQIVGAGVEGGGGTALLYASETLLDWEYVGPVLTAEREDAGDVWECPELLGLGDTQLLHVSNYSDVVYFLGEFADGTFDPDERGLLDYGDYYAPQSTRDDEGRVLTWGWVTEARDGAAQWDAGWSGTLSLPRVLDVDAAGDLRQRPPAELQSLREERLRSGELTVENETPDPLVASGTALEVEATVDLADADEFVLDVFASPDGEERTAVRLTGDELLVDRSESSLDPAASDAPQSVPVEDGTEPVSLRVFLDGSVVEVFVNERRCLTSRVYPERADSDGLAVSATGGKARVESLDIWRLGTAWDPEPAREEQSVRQ